MKVSKKKLWAARILSAIPSFMLLLSGSMKLAKVPTVLQGMERAGYPEHLIVVIGLLEITCVIVYLIPRTAVLGAILMTAFLGGATATNARIGDPSFVMTALFGVLVWAGIYLRDDRLRALVPLRS